MKMQQEGVNHLLHSLLKPAPLEVKLAIITDGIIQHFNADFCRIWLIRPGDRCELGCVHAGASDGPHVCLHRDKCLHLLASSGRYTHLDGAVHRRVPFGCYKIGQIASGEEHDFLISDVAHDPRVHDRDWAGRLGLTSFAGYQIRTPEGETGGVLALFSKYPIALSESALLEGLSNAVALAAQQAVTEENLHLQAVELEQEVGERQMAQESILAQSVELEKEIQKRRTAQDELEKLNEILEQRVLERTAELVEKNAELHKAYEELKNVQAQMLHQDKMASIGQLAAGVAHEINNPMGFIISNLSSLGKYVEKIGAYLDADDRILADCDLQIRQHIGQERLKFRISHIRKDMPELITESEEGAQRIRQIVQDLKRFSRVDGAERAYCDIHEGLESTLSIAWNELKYKSSVVKEYGQLPQVWCSMGQLNQVFLNLLVNAAHAIKDQGEIRIATSAESDTVRIAISDSGCGIAPEALKHIFDPFFTTKEVGKGTGLGLAIAYDIIVNNHGGRIDVTTAVGAGSTFTIILPVKKKQMI